MIPFASPSNPVLDAGAFYILPKDLLGIWKKKKAPVDAKCCPLW